MKKLPSMLLVTAFAVAATLSGCSARKPSPADLEAYLRARDLYLRGAVEEAGALVTHIESRKGAFHQARLLEGKILFFKGSMPDSELVFHELVSRFPGYTEAQLWMLRALQAQGKGKEAELFLSEVLEKNPGDPRFLHQAGILRLSFDDISGALDFFRRSQAYATELSQSYIETARIQYRFGLTESALSDIAIARALLPPDSGLRKPLADLEKRIQEDRK